MTDAVLALTLGLASGFLSLLSLRLPVLGWIAFAPLGVAVFECSPAGAALAGAVAGALANGREVADRNMRAFGILASAISAATWAAGFGLAARIAPAEPVWMPLVLPLTVVLVHLPLRFAGAPGWHNNPIGQAQARFASVVHTSKLGGDLTPTALLALCSASVAMLLIQPAPSTAFVFGGCFLVVGGMLAFGRRSFEAASRRCEKAPTVRVAAVVVNGPPPTGRVSGTWPIESPAYREVEATLARYRPHVQTAALQGAELVLLPEVCVTVDRHSRQRFMEGVGGLARANEVVLVAPFFDASIPKNELVVVDSSGSVVARYEKQHPVAHVEGKRERRMDPGPVPVRVRNREITLSTVLCVDLDYRDLVAPVHRAGGILLAPSNDWPVFDELHHRSAIWSAVATGVSVVRATGWGISAAYDGAGRVLSQASSHEGPVVLTVDVPLAQASDDATGGVREHSERESR